MVKLLPALAQNTGANNQTGGIEFTFVTKWGSLGDEPGQFDGQNSVAASNNSIYVADYYNERMQMFTPEGEFVKMWGGTYGNGDGEFQKPHGVAVDSEGNVYVSERSGLRIQKFDSDGNFITKWGSEGTADGQFQHLHDIAVGPGGPNSQVSSPNDEFVYITDHELFNVQKFTTDGQFVTKWGSEGTGDGQFDGLESVDVDSEGNVYVADVGNHRIQKFNPDGQFLLSWGSFGSEPGQFDSPAGVAVGNNDNIFITDVDNHRVQVFTNNGEFITQIGWPEEASDREQQEEGSSELIIPAGSSVGACCNEGGGDGQFNAPEGLDVDPQNRVIVADTGNNRIQIFEQNPAI
jgi:sugar lactone lactonase YvrE